MYDMAFALRPYLFDLSLQQVKELIIERSIRPEIECEEALKINFVPVDPNAIVKQYVISITIRYHISTEYTLGKANQVAASQVPSDPSSRNPSPAQHKLKAALDLHWKRCKAGAFYRCLLGAHLTTTGLGGLSLSFQRPALPSFICLSSLPIWRACQVSQCEDALYTVGS